MRIIDADPLLDEINDRYEFYTSEEDAESSFVAATLSYIADEIKNATITRMTNRQWVVFLSEQFDISRTSAKEMLHGMMRWKKEDNFKKMFNGRSEII